MKRIICLLSILSLLLCACSLNTENDIVSKDSETSSASSGVKDIPKDPVYLPLDYMYAINLDTGGKVTPGMTREEVEKVFPYDSKEHITIYESHDENTYYHYSGLLFSYYDDVLHEVFLNRRINLDLYNFNRELAGLHRSDLDMNYDDVIEKFGEPSYRKNNKDYYINYFCHIEKKGLRVLSSKEQLEDEYDKDYDYKEYISIKFLFDADNIVYSVSITYI